MIKEFQLAQRVSENFLAGEFICKCPTCRARGIVYLETTLINALQGFRNKIGKPINLTPNGGNRCEVWNRQVGGAASSRHLSLVNGKPQHCDGVDIWVQGIEPDDLAVMAERQGFNGVGVYAPGNRHIHADTRPGTGARWWLRTSNSNTPGFGGVPCVFQQGNRSPAITKIQAALGMKPDGKGTMDAATVSALKARQAASGLTPDGVYGPGANAKLKVFDWSSPGIAADDDAPAAVPSLRLTLRMGDRGEDVRYLQGRLSAKGYALSADGSFGPATLAAVTAMQRAAGLAPDGVVGLKTWAALVEEGI